MSKTINKQIVNSNLTNAVVNLIKGKSVISKKLLVLTALIIISNFSFGVNETIVKSKINNVTVFLNGAQVFRNSKINIKKGITEIVFDSISSTINANSIQVKGKGNYIILDTKYKLIQPKLNNIAPEIPKKIVAEIQRIKDSLDLLGFNLEEIKYRKDVLELEKQLLLGNKSMKSDSLQLLKDALSFFREKYNNINSSLIKAKKDEYIFNKKKTALQTRLNKINANNAKIYVAKPSYPKHQIVVTVSADVATYGTIDINYLVSGASWSPKYDIRATGINKPIELTYKATVYQNSGENWDNIKLKLSTNNPNKSKVKPVLPVWYLNYYVAQQNRALTGSVSKVVGTESLKYNDESADLYEEMTEKLAPAQSSAYYATMNENLTNIEFDISIPYTIPSDGQNHMVAVKNEKLNAKYQYYMVPKLDKDAFLVANIKGFEELSLLPAKATVYFEGTLIGETMLNPDVMGDSLAITLGRDERIAIRRKLVKEEKKEKFLGEDVIKYFTYELSLKNNRNNDVDIIVEDHIPVSQLDEIKVGLLNDSKANYKKETGMMTWSIKLLAKQSKKMEYKYSVEHKKDKPLAIR